jgi:dihydroxy-acid dehydratase
MGHREFRSSRWFARSDEMGLRHRAVLGTIGFDAQAIAGKPIIGICNPASDFNACEVGFRELVPAIKEGILEAGGIPLEFPVMALGADLLKPADMLYRNLVSMDVEESIRGYPVDGVVLLANCDKTTPAQLMAAASADIPALQFSGGPKPIAYFRNEAISSGTDLWKFWDEYRAGQMNKQEWRQFEACLACSHGACNEMGTTSSMTALSEALGMMPFGTSTIPANDGERLQAAKAAGQQIVEMVHQDIRPSSILTQKAFENGIRLLAAIGGSTNAIIHLIAIAGRRGIKLPLSLFDELSRNTPLVTNLKPSGQYLLADFHAAGGVPALLKQIAPYLHLDCQTYSGRTLGEEIANASNRNPEVIRPLENALNQGGALVALTGNLIPLGAMLKVSAASPHLLDHTGPALVFDDYEEMLERLNSDDLCVTADHVLVLRNAGPCGVPGMPEWGQIPIPTKLLKQGIRDLVRISDARMSGTSYGTVVLHAAPESAVGGPLAVVQDGDLIRLNVAERRLDLLISDEELQARLAQWSPPPSKHLRGYPRLYVDHVLQADAGCDFDFLRPESAEELVFVEPQVGRS